MGLLREGVKYLSKKGVNVVAGGVNVVLNPLRSGNEAATMRAIAHRELKLAQRGGRLNIHNEKHLENFYSVYGDPQVAYDEARKMYPKKSAEEVANMIGVSTRPEQDISVKGFINVVKAVGRGLTGQKDK